MAPPPFAGMPGPGYPGPSGMLPPAGTNPNAGPALGVESRDAAAAAGGAANAAPTTMGDWQILKTPEGKSYYFNKRTQITTWEKPSELMGADEVAEPKEEWQEFTTPEGKPYYFNAKVCWSE
jgi:hypothetical protein